MRRNSRKLLVSAVVLVILFVHFASNAHRENKHANILETIAGVNNDIIRTFKQHSSNTQHQADSALELAKEEAASAAAQGKDEFAGPDELYSKLFGYLQRYKPVAPPKDKAALRQSGCVMGDVGLTDDSRFSNMAYDNLDRCYNLSPEQFDSLHSNHAKYVSKLKKEFELGPDSPLLDKLFPNEKGIVTVGGGRFSLLSLTMIRVLRERGTTLPVEVVIPPADEGDDDFCNNVLPALNGSCVYFSDVLSKSTLNQVTFKRYQIKGVALLLSSFKNTIFLDADNFAMKPLDNIFESEAYLEHGLVLWPDLWRRVTAPVFYNVSDVELDLTKRARFIGDDVTPASKYHKPDADLAYNKAKVPLHDLDGAIPDPSSESGQMIVDKREHFQTLLLALYYNYYGPDWYYRMFSQGTSGEGDKETFVAAAHVLSKPYYQVKSKLGFAGYWDEYTDGGFKGAALLQHDFVQDYDQHKKALEVVHSNYEEYSRFDPNYNSEKDFYKKLMVPDGKEETDVMFVHASFHKFDPWDLYRRKTYLKPDGKSQFRSYRDLKRLGGFDLELFNFEVLEDALCAGKQIGFKYLQDKITSQEWPGMCEYVHDRVQFLKETHAEALGTK